jgi:hypothetical protein
MNIEDLDRAIAEAAGNPRRLRTLRRMRTQALTDYGRRADWPRGLDGRRDPVTPACHTWPVQETLLNAAGSVECGTQATGLLADWQQGRCAICGLVPDGRLVRDHDHETGRLRGLLCSSDNTREALGGGVFVLYRARPPAVILGLNVRYRRDIADGIR